jgi:rare lipoprotein A (peptidoglycan hydrolase)
MSRSARRRIVRGGAIALALMAGCGGARPTQAPSPQRGPSSTRKSAKVTPERATPTTSEPQAVTPDERAIKPPAKSDPGDDEPREVGAVQHGEAVWYGSDWHGKPTASGERFNKHKMTAAHRTLPMGAMVRVTNTDNGKNVTVRINDRGPYGKRRRRIIDVSEAAAHVLGIVEAGVAPISVEVLSLPPSRKAKAR